MLKVGIKPNINTDLTDQNNNTVNLSTVDSKYIVIFFYPMDFTPGCTSQACSYRDNISKFEELGAKVFGVSSDSNDSHQNFSNTFKLNYPILTDKDNNLRNIFCELKKNNLLDKFKARSIRATFILNSSKEIIKVWEKVDPSSDSSYVIEYLKSLTK
jgi:peroxiredoxin Q/BCP